MMVKRQNGHARDLIIPFVCSDRKTSFGDERRAKYVKVERNDRIWVANLTFFKKIHINKIKDGSYMNLK